MSTTWSRLVPVMVAVMVAHVAIAPQLRVLGVGADLLLLATVAAGLTAGPERAAAIGFAAGLLADCFLLTPFGLSALVFSLVGWLVGQVQGTILHADGRIGVVITFAATASGVLLFALAGAVVGHGHLVSGRLPVVAVVAAALNAVLAPWAVRVMGWAVGGRSTSGPLLLR